MTKNITMNLNLGFQLFQYMGQVLIGENLYLIVKMIANKIQVIMLLM